ncbi:hypothetical protein ACLOJK_036105 [Asimina triloba]
MAAASSHRCPSPVPERRSPNHKTQETTCSIRRSFSGNPTARSSISSVPRAYNPVTPVNSPAGIKCPPFPPFHLPRRNSMSKEAVPAFRASYEKENESDRILSKQFRMKSPVASTGTKNFMAPTISAASKVIPSPRKKVLTERNETVRTSLTSTCEGKSLFPCLNSSEFKEAKEIGSKPDMGGLDSQVLSDTPKPLKVSFQPRNVDFESNEQMDACSLPVLPSPETGGQSLPPYDPETNYLSPRPMFLRYKPNPRIEVYLNGEKDFDPGEDEKSLEVSSFESSCSDDTEPTEETPSPNTEKESDGSFSLESGDEVDEESSAESDEEEEEDIPRSRFFPRPKSFLSFLFVLAIVCVSASVIDPPGLLSSSFIGHQPFDKTYASAIQVLEHPFLRDSIAELSEIANANLERAVYHFRRLSIKCLAHVFSAVSLPGEEYASPFQFGNLTADVSGVSENKIMADANQIRDVCETERKEIVLHHEIEEEFGQAAYREHVEIEEEMDETTAIAHEEEEEVDPPAESELGSLKKEEPALITPAIFPVATTEPALIETDETGEKFHIDSQADIDLVEEEISRNLNSPTAIETDSASRGAAEDAFLMQKTPAPITEPASMETDETPEKFDTDSQADIDLMGEEISSNANSQTGIETPHSPEIHSVVSHGAVEDGFQMQKTLGVALTVLGLLVAAVLSRRKAKKLEPAEVPEIHNAAIAKETEIHNATIAKEIEIHNATLAKEMDPASASASSDNAPLFDGTPLNGPSEVEMVGNSGPYDVSSSLQMSSSGGGQRRSERGEVEIQSYQRRGRRSSSSHSYSESPSYGSFTAYEKLQSKQGCGDDEAMTPVRRSSRLRKPIMTSP